MSQVVEQMSAKIKILIIGLNYRPELTGIGKFTGEMAEWLVENDVQVRVITAPPYYPAWSVSDNYSAIRYSSESLAGVRILRCPLWVPSKPTGVKRLVHLASYALSSLIPTLWLGMTWRPNWIMVLEPPLMCLPGALLAAKLSGSQTWLHIQDYEVDAAFELGLLRSQFLRRVALGIERWLKSRVDSVSTISERMYQKLEFKDVAPHARFLFPNWVDTDLIRPLQDVESIRSEYGIDKRLVVLLYSGNMGEKQGIEIIIDAAARLATDSRFIFLLCGDGAARKKLEIQAKDLDNVRFIPLQPLEQFNKLLNIADIHLLPQLEGAEDLVMPSKLTAMLASGRPVVATARAGTQVAQVVDRCGIVVPPGERDAFVSAIRRLGENATSRAELGAAGRAYAMKYWAKRSVLTNLLSVLKKSLNNK